MAAAGLGFEAPSPERLGWAEGLEASSPILEAEEFAFCAAHVAPTAGPGARLQALSYRVGLRLVGWPGAGGGEEAEAVRGALGRECGRLHERVLLPTRGDALRVVFKGGSVAVVCQDRACLQLSAGDCLPLPIAGVTLEELAVFLWSRLVERCAASLRGHGVDFMRVIVWEGPLRSASFGKVLPADLQGPPPEPEPLADESPALRLRPRRVVLLTGASRGYGRALAEALAAEAAAARRPTHLVLVARDEAGLRETVQAASGEGVSHYCVPMDLANPAQLAQQMGPVLDHLEAEIAHRGPPVELLILHNAGSLGPLLYCRDISASDTQLAIDLNVTSFAILTSAVLGRFAPIASAPDGTGLRVRVVNVSSLLAVEAFPAWSLYAMGKAARDMAMQVVAREAEAQGLDVRTLSWAPGPMRTAMVDRILGECADPGVLENFRRMDQEDSFVPMDASAGKLLKLLAEDAYASGAHIDFFDN